MKDATARTTMSASSRKKISHIVPRLRDQNFEAEEGWKDRPVRVYHVREGNQDEEQFFALGSDSHYGDLLRCLEARGFYPRDVINMQDGGVLDDFVWPRNMAWRVLPVLSGPTFENRYASLTVIDEFGHGHLPHDTARGRNEFVAAGTRVLVIAARDLTRRVLAGFARLVAGVPALDVLHFDGTGLMQVNAEALAAALDFHNADARFVFNHAVNTVVITARAFLKIARENGHSQAFFESRTPKLDSYAWKFGHPLAIQALYAVARLDRPGADETPLRPYEEHERYPWVMARSLPFFESDADGDRFVWRGSGRYPEWAIALGEVAPGKVQDRNGVHVSPHWIFQILEKLFFAGLVGVYGDRARLTPAGARFLDLIGTEMDDADVLLRWRDGERFGAAENVPAMDRWLNRAFRSIKRKVAGLPASPLTELVDAPWPAPAVNELYVRGHRLAFDEAALSEDRVREVVAAARAHEETTRLEARRFGLITRDIGFGETPEVTGLWVGVPIAVTSGNGQERAEADLFKDWRSTDAAYEAALAALPAWIGEDSKPGLVWAGGTSLAPATVNAVAPLVDVTEKSTVAKVYLGHVLAIGDLGGCDKELRRYVGMQSLGRMFMPMTDGIRTYGYGNQATLVYGMLVGYRDAQSGKTYVQERVCEGRTRNIDHLMSIWRRDLPLVFGHPDMSEHGYWLVSPSGAVSPVDAGGEGVVLI